MLPRATEILKATGFVDDRYFQEYSRSLGEAVHAATALDDRGQLDEESVAPEVKPYLETWRKWVQTNRPEWLAIESEEEDSVRGYQYHPDRRCKINDEEWVIDLKCGVPASWHSIQTAAYANGRTVRRATVYLRPGNWTTREHTDRRDWNVFLAALTVYHWQVLQSMTWREGKS